MTSASSRGDGLFRCFIWVSAGYLAAFVLASVAVAVRFVTTSGPDSQASSGHWDRCEGVSDELDGQAHGVAISAHRRQPWRFGCPAGW